MIWQKFWHKLNGYMYSPFGKGVGKKILTGEIIYANHVRRILAFIIDIFIVSLLLQQIFQRFLGQDLAVIAELVSQDPTKTVVPLDTSSVILIKLIMTLYFTGSLVLPWQATIGQAIMGIAVVSMNHPEGKITTLQSFGRFLCYFFLVLPTGFGLVSILISDKRLGIHDDICNTRVVCLYPTVLDKKHDLFETMLRYIYDMLAQRWQKQQKK